MLYFTDDFRRWEEEHAPERLLAHPTRARRSSTGARCTSSRAA